MSDPVFCPWCEHQHMPTVPCPPATIDPRLLMRTPIPASIQPQALRTTTHPNLAVPAAAAAAIPAPTTRTAVDQPALGKQVEPQAGPSNSRSQKRKEAPGAQLHCSITDHEGETQRELRKEWNQADMKRQLAKKPRGQGEQEEEQGGQEEKQAVREGEEEGGQGIDEGEKVSENVLGDKSVITQRLVRAVAGWKAKAQRLEAEMEVLRARLEEERKRNEEEEMWRQNTLEPF